VNKPMVDFVKRTGEVPANLSKAIASGQPTPTPGFQNGGEVGNYGQKMVYSPTTHINNPIVRNDNDLVAIRRMVEQAQDESARQFNRRGFELVPGMG